MSEQHVKRLKDVRMESKAAIEALDRSATYSLSIPKHYQADARDLRHAANNAEATYYFRLISEMEGMLYSHLHDHFASFSFEESDGATSLVNHCRHRLNAKKNDHLPSDLVEDVLAVVAWRNWIVHGQRGIQPPLVPFLTAHRRIHDLVLLLPPMKGAHE